MPQIVLLRRASRYFERLDELARDPFQLSGVKPMQGEWKGHYRVRHGDAAASSSLLDQANDTVVVGHIGPRGEIYK